MEPTKFASMDLDKKISQVSIRSNPFPSKGQ